MQEAKFAQATMSNEELIFDWKNNNNQESRAKLFLNLQSLVFSIANDFLKKTDSNFDIDDLVQEGFLGVHEGLETYDISKGAKVSTWVCYRITRYIKNYIDKNYSITVSPYATKQAFRVIKTAKKYQELSLSERILRISEDTNIKPQKVELFLTSLWKSIYLEDTATWIKGPVIQQSLANYEYSCTADKENDLLWAVQAGLEKLDHLERSILKMYFGLGYTKAYLLVEISKKLNLSIVKTREKKKTALFRLRKFIEEEL